MTNRAETIRKFLTQAIEHSWAVRITFMDGGEIYDYHAAAIGMIDDDVVLTVAPDFDEGPEFDFRDILSIERTAA